ncbi:hypothetical protein SUNI508_05968 [Seiridium unicorne]|uniref:Pathway-specific nitrogen regulator n=1 Tax=Seiridium unicorne TaxID=138068 RepID=A0ABR2V2I1_9PEZI
MEEETRSQTGDIETAGDAASVHEDTQIDASEPHTDETIQADDAVDTSLMSDNQSVEGGMAETLQEDETPGFADSSILSHDDDGDDLEAPLDNSYAEDSVLEEEENDQEEAESQADEGSILPSIESDIDNDAHDISVLEDSMLEDDRSSHMGSSRRTSGRTEALIQQAARDIVAQIETHQTEPQQGDHGDESVLSSCRDASEDQQDPNEISSMQDQEKRQSEEHEAPQPADEGGDSSSQHGTDEDVFSEKSHRSSLGSYDGGSESGKGTTIADNVTVATRTPRISDISQYSKEDDFIPTIRGKSRLPFRTPSDVRAMQMSSPPASVLGSVVGSPRSSRRHFPTVSRLGSPAPSAQYSPKNRTPSRFKAKEAPLVLLHVTLLPLRWMWADYINKFDASEMSEEAKTLREAWRMLQDRMGDTVFERGILLGHPQNDYEILEERLLEALDLPMRRRARILECGHYLGPANENTIGDDSESEDEYDAVRPQVKKHWCNTCRNEIRYEALGAGRIFRVKVYASNGLMKAGAWDACWKEMERVDIELEPIIEPGVNEELSRLAAAQQEREDASHKQIELAAEVIQQIEDQVDEQMSQSFDQQPDLVHAQLEIAPAPSEPPTNDISVDEDRRYRDEERLKEIYGATPIPEVESRESNTSARQPHPDSYIPPPSPRSPSEEAHERRQARRQSLQSASFTELLLQSARVLIHDTRNIFIIGLSVLVLLMALRSPQQTMIDSMLLENKSAPQVQQVPVMEAPVIVREQAPVAEPIVSYLVVTQSAATQSAVQESVAPTSVPSVHDPCATPSIVQQAPIVMAIESEPVRSAPQEIVTQKTTVRVVQTVTETETLKIETITETETMKVKATVTMTETSQAPEPTMQNSEPLAESSDEVETLETPDVDVEIPIVGTEVPIVDSEVPIMDTEPPAVDSEVPVMDLEPPVVDTEQPAADVEQPVVDYELPAEDLEVPTVGSEVSAPDSEVPVVDSEEPFVEVQMPAAEVEMPLDDVVHPEQEN